MFHALAAARAHVTGESGVGEKSFERGGKLGGIAVLHKVAGDAVEDDFGSAAVSAADDGFGAGHGFEIHEAKTFGRAGQRENFAGGIAGGELSRKVR